jgi:hypothetical protein
MRYFIFALIADGYKADNENSLFSNVGFYILAQHLQICETRKPHLAL